jgi:hypothetical protein
MRLSIAQIAIVILVLYSIGRLLFGDSDWYAVRTLLSIIGFIAVIILPSIFFSKSLALASKQPFTRLELLNLCIPVFLLVLPGLLLVESNVLRKLSPVLLAANTIMSLALLAGLPAGREFLLRRRRLWNAPSRDIRHSLRAWRHAPVFWMVILYVLLITYMNTLYRALPDLDPYTWLTHFNKFLVSQKYPTSLEYRPLFSYLAYYLVEGLQLPTYVIFKYVFPYLALLTVLPAWLVARTYQSRWSQLVILAIPLMVPSTILYLQLPIPQAVVAILAYLFMFWLVYAWKKNSLFYYLAGAISFFGFLHHESIAFLALAWLTITILFDFRRIIAFFKHNTLTATLVIILVVTNKRYFPHVLQFFYKWIQVLKSFVRYDPNWEFPAKYLNIDELNVGWPGLAGVTKYYLFYAGPAVAVFILLTIILLSTSLVYRQKLRSLLLHNKAFALLILTWSLFFVLTEIVPRVMSVALLPDRLWIFLGAVSMVFLISLLDQFQANSRLFASGVLALTIISASGALYINYLKQYLIPNYQVAAATWIKQNLPRDRVVLTDHHTNLVLYFAQSPIIPLPDDFYCDPNVLNDVSIQKDEVLRERLVEHGILRPYPAQQTADFRIALQTFLNENSRVAPEAVLRFVAAYRQSRIANSFDYEIGEHAQAYILYSPTHPRHPYAARAYQQASEPSDCLTPVFDDYPDRFKKVYADGTRVIIWQWL